MDPITQQLLLASAAAAGAPEIGDEYEGGFFAGYISHNADGVATHALIVAPAATGATGTGYTLTTRKKWQTTTSNTGATSLYDGASNTALMTNSPAADFCTGLTINGHSDLYLPARDELEIAYFNFKPKTDNNVTYVGVNNYAVPKRTSNYTTGNPAQTSVVAFQFGNSEAFIATYHWSSTDSTSTTANIILFEEGAQSAFNKVNAQRVRAFRKVAV